MFRRGYQQQCCQRRRPVLPWALRSVCSVLHTLISLFGDKQAELTTLLGIFAVGISQPIMTLIGKTRRAKDQNKPSSSMLSWFTVMELLRGPIVLSILNRLTAAKLLISLVTLTETLLVFRTVSLLKPLERTTLRRRLLVPLGRLANPLPCLAP